MEGEGEQGEDGSKFWRLEIERERIFFVDAAGTEEYGVMVTALEEATMVAMDGEWKPVRRAGVSPRVSIMQISCRIRGESEAWAGIDRVLLARRVRAEAEERLRGERVGVERERGEVERVREELERERRGMREEVERERRKVRAERESLKRERAEKKRRDRREREEIERARSERRREEEEEEDVDTRPTLTKIQEGLKGLVLGRNGEISEVAEDLAGGVDVQRDSGNEGVTPRKVDTEDAEQNMDNLMDVLAQAQKELMKHEDGEQHTLHTEANLETLSKNEVLDEKPETNYAFAGDKNLLEENGLRSRDTEIEENKVDRNFDRNDLIQDEPRRGKEVGASSRNEASEQVGGGIRETERGSSNEQVTDTGSGGEDDSDGDQEFSDAAEDEFEVEKEVDEDIDSAPELVRRAGDSKDGVGLTEEESEKSKGEEVIFLLDLLALSAVDIAFPMKKMLCSPRILKLGFAFKQDQIHLAASFSGPEACGCFDKVEPYIDISKLYKQLLHANSTTVKHKGRRFVLGGTYSLSGISKAVLGHHLRKDAQCSDWEQRPLTEDQIYYAASDTHCLLAIFDTLLADALALISPVPAPAPAPAQNDRGDKPGLTIQQRASSLRDSRGEGLKFLTGSNNMRGTTSGSYIFTPKMSTASQMVEAALRPSPVSSPHESVVATAEQECSGERFSKFVKKYSERLLVNEESRSRSHARRPRGRRAREALKNPDSNNEINLEWIGPAPWDVRIGGDGTPKFLCDVMVEGLARQLRCVGVDAASPPTKKSDPRQMVEQAMGEGRVLLTKDIKLLRRRLMPDNLAHFVKNLGKWEQLAEVMKVFQITVSESDLLSRCVKCNGEFTPRPLTSKEAKEQAPATQDVPKSVLETCDEYWQCSVCGHLFWQGFQFDRARQKFAAVCVKPNDDDLVPETIQPLDIACEFLEEPEKAFALGLPTV